MQNGASAQPAISRIWPWLDLVAATVLLAGISAILVINMPKPSKPMVAPSFPAISLSEVKAKHRLDPGIVGFVDILARSGNTVRALGWAVDTDRTKEPLVVAVFGAEKALGLSATTASRPDVEPHLKLVPGVPTGFGIVTQRPCLAGQFIEVLAVSSDGRYNQLLYAGAPRACPLGTM